MPHLVNAISKLTSIFMHVNISYQNKSHLTKSYYVNILPFVLVNRGLSHCFGSLPIHLFRYCRPQWMALCWGSGCLTGQMAGWMVDWMGQGDVWQLVDHQPVEYYLLEKVSILLFSETCLIFNKITKSIKSYLHKNAKHVLCTHTLNNTNKLIHEYS